MVLTEEKTKTKNLDEFIVKTKPYRFYKESNKTKYIWQCFVYKNKFDHYYFVIKTKGEDSKGNLKFSQTARYEDITFESWKTVRKKLKEKIERKFQKGWTEEN